MRPGTPWGEPADAEPGMPVVDVTGGDADLAVAVRAHPGAVLRFVPDHTSDLARALGLAAGTTAQPGHRVDPARGTVLPCDVLVLDDARRAVNAVVSGVAPDRLRRWHRTHPVTVEVDGRVVGEGRATTVVVASGQFLRGTDLAPRGHPGDGRIEVQVYALGPGERRPMRARLPGGDHVPHPHIAQASGRTVVVRWTGSGRRARRGVPLEVDGRPAGRTREIGITVTPGAARVLL